MRKPKQPKVNLPEPETGSETELEANNEMDQEESDDEELASPVATRRMATRSSPAPKASPVAPHRMATRSSPAPKVAPSSSPGIGASLQSTRVLPSKTIPTQETASPLDQRKSSSPPRRSEATVTEGAENMESPNATIAEENPSEIEATPVSKAAVIQRRRESPRIAAKKKLKFPDLPKVTQPEETPSQARRGQPSVVMVDSISYLTEDAEDAILEPMQVPPLPQDINEWKSSYGDDITATRQFYFEQESLETS